MRQRRTSLLLAALLLLAAGPARALDSDRQQPVNLDAGHATLNNATGVSVYTGNVVLTQGSMRLTADKMTVYTTPAGQISKVIAEGKDATFRQLPEGQTEYVNAKAPYMEYVATAPAAVLLKGGATVAQARNTVTGENIRYDMEKDVVVAQSDERIRMIYYPEDKPAAAEKPAEKPAQ